MNAQINKEANLNCKLKPVFFVFKSMDDLLFYCKIIKGFYNHYTTTLLKVEEHNHYIISISTRYNDVERYPNLLFSAAIECCGRRIDNPVRLGNVTITPIIKKDALQALCKL